MDTKSKHPISMANTQSKDSSTAKAKEAAGKAAANFVKPGMILGIGTGSTVAYFITELAERVKQGLHFTAVVTSNRSAEQAQSLGIPLVDINTITSIDLTIDGADEIDPKNRMIKGGGGALLREKIVANVSKDMVVIIDQHKLVNHLGKFPLPLELVTFATPAIIHKINALGYHGTIRRTKEGKSFITDNGNVIYDINLDYPCMHPENDNEKLRSIPGVVETGFFFNLAKKVVIGYDDGHTEIRT